MPDKILICQNCNSPFVYSEYEQKIDIPKSNPEPTLCTICSTIKKSEASHPPKPTSKL